MSPNTSSVLFVENLGQFDSRVRFEVIGTSLRLRLTDDGLWLTVLEPKLRERIRSPGSLSPVFNKLRSPGWAVHLRLSFVDSNTKTQPKPLESLPSLVSYLHGSDPTAWRRKVPVWSGVVYPDLYPGADLYVQGNGPNVELRLQSDPKVPLEKVRLRIEGAELVVLGSRPLQGSDSDQQLEGLSVSTALGSVFLPLVLIDRELTSKTFVDQVGLNVFDVVYPFTTERKV